MKGLVEGTASGKRFRFKSVADRLSVIQVNATKSLRHSGLLDSTTRNKLWTEQNGVEEHQEAGATLGGDGSSSSSGGGGSGEIDIGARSLTYMELSRCCSLYRERRFQRLYYALRDKVASLPEVLHQVYR